MKKYFDFVLLFLILDYIKALCIDNEAKDLTPKEVKVGFTSQVGHARRLLKMTCTEKNERKTKKERSWHSTNSLENQLA